MEPRECKKHGYPTKKDAATARNRRLASRQRNRPDFLRAYACEDCGKWHLTHQRKWEPEN